MWERWAFLQAHQVAKQSSQVRLLVMLVTEFLNVLQPGKLGIIPGFGLLKALHRRSSARITSQKLSLVSGASGPRTPSHEYIHPDPPTYSKSAARAPELTST